MSDEKVPRFLQQTTSQLLHQQEALRKRREMLERESAKPPAMRFGTGSPPRSHSRHGKSPVPPSSSQSTPPRGDNVRRELNWSRTDDETAAERAPMRFSMTFRPAPTPVVSMVAGGRSRTTTAGLHLPSSPTPRDVNTSDHVSTIARKAARDGSSPRAVSPRSPPPQRLRAENSSAAVEGSAVSGGAPLHNAHVPVQVTDWRQELSASKTDKEAADTVAEHEEKPEEEEEREMTRAEKQQSLPLHLPLPPPFPTIQQVTTVTADEGAERESDAEPTGIAGFSNTFAVPRYTPTTPLTTPEHNGETEAKEEDEGNAEASTPGRPAVGEFRTPRPVTRMSTSLTPIVRNTATQTNPSDAQDTSSQSNNTNSNRVIAEHHTHEDEGEVPSSIADTVRDAASPAPTPSQIFASLEASSEKRRGGPTTPAMSRDHEEKEDRSLSHTIDASVSRSVGQRTPSPSRRTKASPAPTTQDLIQSVQASADRRPCGCQRPTPSPSPEHASHRRGTSPASRPTASPPPTPVPLSDRPMTEFHAAVQKCCDRPTPASLSSQPAGGEAHGTAAPSASPWPTTENIISSIMAGAQEEKRRARAASAAADNEEEEGTAAEHFSNGEEEGDGPLSSPTAAAHTPSPVPTERQYGQSVLASTEKRRCGRPTPSERVVSLVEPPQGEKTEGDRNDGTVADSNASPQPTAHHLLDSLDVSIGKATTREKPAERVSEATASDEEENGEPQAADDASREASAPNHASSPSLRGVRTPSPTPTPEHVIASLQASADKRTRSAAMAKVQSTDVDTNHSGGSADVSPRSNAFQSPMLTPQNVKDSIQKLVDDKQLSRSDAQAPQRPWGENGTSGSDAKANDSASPVVTAEDVDMSLATLEQDRRCNSRSARGDREADYPSPSSHDGGNGRAKSGTAAESETLTSSQATAPPAPPAATSPAPSDFATQSAMFFDCVSAPITPSLPTVEAAVAVARITKTTTATVVNVTATRTTATARVPAQLLELQREITAISEGRSRTHTPPPLHASESSSPVAVVREVGAATHAEVSLELPTSPAVTVAQEEEEEDKQVRRSSLLLVQPTRSHQALLQRPHEPVPVILPPTISPVQVPRTPTPPPRNPQQTAAAPTAGKRESLPRRLEMHVRKEYEEEIGESPLPRPVSLRSQVSLPKHPLSQPKMQLLQNPVSVGPTPVPSERPTAVFHDDYTLTAAEEAEHNAAVPAPTLRCRRSDCAEDEEEDLFDSKNDWMDLVEPLQPHTITVSPQGGAVVYTTHSPHSNEEESVEEKESSEPLQRQPSATSPSPFARKRSRSVGTPVAAGATAASRHTATMTPASVALTMDDGVSTGGKSSDLLTHTPSSHVSQTPRSSTRGRRSQAEELLAMLPEDVVAEVTRMEEEGEEEDSEGDSSSPSRPSKGSPASRISGLSADESTTAQMSTISQRVSQRPPRVRRNRDDYIQYLEGIARSSAKRTRAAAGRRMQKTIIKDLAAAGKQRKGISAAATEPSPEAGKATPTSTSPVHRSRRTTSTGGSLSESPYDSADLLVSPVTPSPVHGGEGARGPARSQLVVSTRLSAELRHALFRDSPATVPPPSPVSPQQKTATAVSSKASKKAKMAKKAVVASPKRGSPAKATKPSPKSSPAPAVTKTALGHHGKKKTTVRKFVTAKSLRSVTHSAQPKKKH